MPTVLVVDDERSARQSLIRALTLEGFAVREAADGLGALDAISTDPPHAAVLDAAMPGLTGVEVVRRLRAEGRTLPICLLSTRGGCADRTAGLAAGADDCMVKPFFAGELAARLHALVQPRPDGDRRPLMLGDLTIEPAWRRAERRGRDLHLTDREFDLLLALGRHPEQVLTRAQLLAQVWCYSWDADVLDVIVDCLRDKLEAAGQPTIVNSVAGGFVLRP